MGFHEAHSSVAVDFSSIDQDTYAGLVTMSEDSPKSSILEGMQI